MDLAGAPIEKLSSDVTYVSALSMISAESAQMTRAWVVKFVYVEALTKFQAGKTPGFNMFGQKILM